VRNRIALAELDHKARQPPNPRFTTPITRLAYHFKPLHSGTCTVGPEGKAEGAKTMLAAKGSARALLGHPLRGAAVRGSSVIRQCRLHVDDARQSLTRGVGGCLDRPRYDLEAERMSLLGGRPCSARGKGGGEPRRNHPAGCRPRRGNGAAMVAFGSRPAKARGDGPKGWAALDPVLGKRLLVGFRQTVVDLGRAASLRPAALRPVERTGWWRRGGLSPAARIASTKQAGEGVFGVRAQRRLSGGGPFVSMLKTREHRLPRSWPTSSKQLRQCLGERLPVNATSGPGKLARVLARRIEAGPTSKVNQYLELRRRSKVVDGRTGAPTSQRPSAPRPMSGVSRGSCDQARARRSRGCGTGPSPRCERRSRSAVRPRPAYSPAPNRAAPGGALQIEGTKGGAGQSSGRAKGGSTKIAIGIYETAKPGPRIVVLGRGTMLPDHFATFLGKTSLIGNTEHGTETPHSPARGLANSGRRRAGPEFLARTAAGSPGSPPRDRGGSNIWGFAPSRQYRGRGARVITDEQERGAASASHWPGPNS